MTWCEEHDQEKFDSIVEMLLQNESFCKLPSGDQNEFCDAVRACEKSNLVQTDLGHMSPFRATQLTNLLRNWCESSAGGVHLPFDVRKKDLRVILANHLYRPVFVPSAENAAKVKTQLEAIPESPVSISGGNTEPRKMPKSGQDFIELILPRLVEGITNDMTPLFKYPLADDAYGGLLKDISRVSIPINFNHPNSQYMSMAARSKIESLIVQAYTEAIPTNVRQEVETLVKSAEEFTDAEHLAETISEIVQSQHERELKRLDEEFYGEFNRRAEMIRLEENGKILEGDIAMDKKAPFSVFQIFCMATGLLLVFIVIIRIIFRMMQKR